MKITILLIVVFLGVVKSNVLKSVLDEFLKETTDEIIVQLESHKLEQDVKDFLEKRKGLLQRKGKHISGEVVNEEAERVSEKFRQILEEFPEQVKVLRKVIEDFEDKQRFSLKTPSPIRRKTRDVETNPSYIYSEDEDSAYVARKSNAPVEARKVLDSLDNFFRLEDGMDSDFDSANYDV